ncbi:MAG: hypothetical protein ACYS7Y_19105 [Planctomycetota bacterium]|jgi:hypothetical protein
MPTDNSQLLKWCADNGIHIKIVDSDGTLLVTAVNRNISAAYAVHPPVGHAALGTALWAAIRAVRDGTEHEASLRGNPPV